MSRATLPRIVFTLALMLAVLIGLDTHAGAEPSWVRLQVFATDSGQILFDSGVISATELEPRLEAARLGSEEVAFELRTFTNDGQLIDDRAAVLAVGDLISSFDFETFTQAEILGTSIILDGPVNVTGTVTVDQATRTSALENSVGSAFFDPCNAGQALRELRADGTVICETVGGGGDDLGNHTATQSIVLGSFWLSGDGDAEGVRVAATGAVGIGEANPVERLEVAGNVRLAPDSTIYFGSGTSTRLFESSGNLTLAAQSADSSDVQLSAEDNIELEAEDDIFVLPDDDIFMEPNDDIFMEPGSGVAFGNVSNPSRLIEVEQGTSKDPIADQWDTYSSLRWKSAIRPIDRPLDLLAQLEGVRYTSLADGRQEIGLIAEHVGAVLPEIVTYEEDGEFAQSIAYGRLVALLIEAAKEQSRQIDALAEEVQRLRAKRE